MVDHKPSNQPGAEKRRSTRLDQRVPITVSGKDALGQEFTERTSTVAVNVHGAAFNSSHYVLRDTVLTIELAGAKPGDAPHQARCKVIRANRPQKSGEPFRVAVQLEHPENIWGVALPPKDWKPFLDEHAPVEEEAGASIAEPVTAQAAPPPAGYDAGVAATTDAEAVKRRSTRIVQSVPLTVMGVNALGQQFKERTSTLIINCHGCKYASKHYVLKNSWLNLEVPHPDPGQPPRVCRARVTFVQRPRTVRELFQVGAELEVAGNLWGIAFPPPDWIPFPADYTPTGELPPPPSPEAAAPPEPSAPPKVRAFPTAAPADVTAALSKHIAKLVADARVQIQQTAKETVSSSVAAETAQLLRTLNQQLEDAARRAVEGATAGFRDEFQSQLAARMEEERSALLESARQQWAAEVDRLATERERTGADTQKASAALQESFTAALEQQLAQAQRRVDDYHRQLAARLEEERQTLLESVRRQWAAEAGNLVAERERAGAESAQATSAMQESFAAALEQQLAGAQRQVEDVHQRLAAAVAALEDSLTARIDQHISEAEQSIQAAAAPVPESIAAQLQQQVEGVRGQMQELLDRMSQTAASLESSLTARMQKGLAEAEEHLHALTAPVPESVAAALKERVAEAQHQMQAAQDRLADAAASIEASLNEKMNQQVAETERRIREAAGEVPATVAAELERQRTAARELLREFVEGLTATQESIQDAFDASIQKHLASAQQRMRDMNAAMETQARSTQGSFASSVQKHLADADESIEKARQGLADTLDLLRGSFTQEIEQHLAGARATAAALESDLSARVEESRGQIGQVSREVEILVHSSIERLRVESE
ncbi:MAG TPA: hypothetical protein VGA40_00910, partial [Candidatus Acidoferrales bacterium]